METDFGLLDQFEPTSPQEESDFGAFEGPSLPGAWGESPTAGPLSNKPASRPAYLQNPTPQISNLTPVLFNM